MPTYLFECPVCHRKVEHTQSIRNRWTPICGKEGLVDHPESDHEETEMEIVIQPSNFVLKGGGWARDGYSGAKR